MHNPPQGAQALRGLMVMLGVVVLDNLGFALALSSLLAMGFGLARQYFRDHGLQAGT